MGYSARRGFTNGKVSGAQRQAEMQQKIQQMQEQMNAAQEAVEAQEFSASVGGGVVEARVNGKKEVLSLTIRLSILRTWRCSRTWWSPPSMRLCARPARPWTRAWRASPAD